MRLLCRHLSSAHSYRQLFPLLGPMDFQSSPPTPVGDGGCEGVDGQQLSTCSQPPSSLVSRCSRGHEVDQVGLTAVRRERGRMETKATVSYNQLHEPLLRSNAWPFY